MAVNPIKQIPRKRRKKFQSKHDPRETPFLHKFADALRVLAALVDPIRVMYAVGLYTGMRPGEIRAMHWDHIFLDRIPPMIQVRRQVYKSRLGPVKDKEARDVPVLTPLQPVLHAWKEETGGKGFLFRPRIGARGGRPGSPATFVKEHTMWRHLRAALRTCGLPKITWYEATKHTFASHWLMNGNSIEKLASILGHSDTEVTRRYGHLRTDLFSRADLDALSGTVGPTLGHSADAASAQPGTSAPEVGRPAASGANDPRLAQANTNGENANRVKLHKIQ